MNAAARAALTVALAWCISAGVAVAVVTPARADVRVALVIGNANYAHAPRLANPANDAAKVAETLRTIGFSSVVVKSDLGADAMRTALQSFSQLASNADMAVVYFAGHGIEISGVNYLVPVDAALQQSGDLQFEAIPLPMLLHAVAGARHFKLIVLDACRNNPFVARMTGDGKRAIGRGLARIEPDSAGTLVAYAAKDGTTALDGAAGNSPFVQALVKEMSTPGLEVRIMFGRVRDAVLSSTNNRQEPFTYGSLGGEAIYFVPPPGGTSVPAAAAPAVDAKAIEIAFWNSVADSNDQAQLQSYLDRYPKGVFAGAARAKLSALRKAAPPAALRPAAPAVSNATLELELWKSVSTSNDEAQLRAYISKFPKGVFADAARAKIAALKRVPTQTASLPPANAGPVVDPAISADVQSAIASARAKSEAAKLAQFKAKKAAEIAVNAAKRAEEDSEAVDVDADAPDYLQALGGFVTAARALSGYKVAKGSTDQGVTWQYEGATTKGRWDGNGVIAWGDGDRYQGEWKNGERSGAGIYRFSNGKRYEGEFVSGAMNGVGVMYLSNGDRYEGDFVNGSWSGFGCYYATTGQVWAGMWKNNNLEGYGGKFDAAGNPTELGLFQADKLQRTTG